METKIKNMKRFEINRFDFMRPCKDAKEIRFRYVKNGNDVWNPCETLQKQATYEFYAIIDGYQKMIVYKQHRRTHDIVQENLEKKYLRWFKIATKNKNYELGTNS